MDQILAKCFDFSIRMVELAKYLDEEEKPFPLSRQLTACAAGIGICFRIAEATGRKSAGDIGQALAYAVEAEYLLEIMVKTGHLQEKQSQPILHDIRAIKALIAGILPDGQ